MIDLRFGHVDLCRGAHVRCLGKGRKERCTPLAQFTVASVKTWLEEPRRGTDGYVFPSSRGGRLSADAVQDMISKHVDVAQQRCSSLNGKRVTPHVLRDRKSTRLNSSHLGISYAVFCLKKK